MMMPLGTEVGLGPGDMVLDRNQSPPPTERGTVAPAFRSVCFGTVAHLSNRWALVLHGLETCHSKSWY